MRNFVDNFVFYESHLNYLFVYLFKYTHCILKDKLIGLFYYLYY